MQKENLGVSRRGKRDLVSQKIVSPNNLEDEPPVVLMSCEPGDHAKNVRQGVV